MAARYGTFARSAFYSTSNRFGASSSAARPPASSRRAVFEHNSASSRRRCAESMIPLHNVVASAKLVTHLGVSTRSSKALSHGFQGYFNSSYKLLPSVKGTLVTDVQTNSMVTPCGGVWLSRGERSWGITTASELWCIVNNFLVQGQSGSKPAYSCIQHGYIHCYGLLYDPISRLRNIFLSFEVWVHFLKLQYHWRIMILYLFLESTY